MRALAPHTQAHENPFSRDPRPIPSTVPGNTEEMENSESNMKPVDGTIDLEKIRAAGF